MSGLSLRECYTAAGADYEDAMRRFMSEERVDRFLTMFLRDRSFELLCDAMEKKEYDEAFRAVHTMKGICMNLGFTELLKACAALTEDLRSGQPGADTGARFETVRTEYQRTAKAIRSRLEG